MTIPSPNPSANESQPRAVLPLELGYAPPAKSQNRAVWVIAVGLVSTALTLAGVYALQIYGDSNIMGWYADYVIPVGAIMVGLAASSGYVLMSWILGFKIRKALLFTILLLLFVSYFAAEYVAFRSGGPRGIPISSATIQTTSGPKVVHQYHIFGFWEYFHYKTINWTWEKKDYEKEDSEPLGMYGYFFVSLAILGFSLSGLILPLALAKRPYCELCERYVRTRQISLLPPSVPIKSIPQKNTEGKVVPDQGRVAKFEEAETCLKRMAVSAGNNDAFAFALDAVRDKAEVNQSKKLPRRLQINLVHCTTCSSGHLAPIWLAGHGKRLKRTRLRIIELTPTFVKALKKIL